MYTVDYKRGLDYYGCVDYLSQQIEINQSVIPARKQAALFHEALHVMDRKLDLNIPHHDVVIIATWMMNILPKIERLRKGQWKIDWNKYPIIISRGNHSTDEIVEEMINYILAFNKIRLPRLAEQWISKNITSYFNFPNRLDEESGEWS